MPEIKIKLKPFTVPNFILVEMGKVAQRQDGFKEGLSYAIKDIPKETLVEMCEEFKQAVLQKWEEGRLSRDRGDRSLAAITEAIRKAGSEG